MEENPNQGSAQLEEKVSDQSVSGDGKENVQTKTHEDNVPSYEWHRRVLGENKKYKSQLNEAQARLKAYEEAEMEAKGKHQDLIEALRTENQKLRTGIEERDQVYEWSKRSESLKNELTRQGCIKSDHLLRLMDESMLNEIQIDDTYNAVQEDVQRVVESFKADPDYQYLFKQKTNSVDTVTPMGKVQKAAPRKLSSLTRDEVARMLANPELQKDLLK